MIVGKVHEIDELFYGFGCSDCAYYPPRIYRSLLLLACCYSSENPHQSPKKCDKNLPCFGGNIVMLSG